MGMDESGFLSASVKSADACSPHHLGTGLENFLLRWEYFHCVCNVF